MATVPERLEALPVVELAEVREKLRLNAEEREALEATAKQLLEAWAAVDTPPPPPPQAAPPPAQADSLTQRLAAGASFAEVAILTLNLNPGNSFSAPELAALWHIRSENDVSTIRSALARCAVRGAIRRVGHGRYKSIRSG
jgi:hypothetical protein